MADLSFTLNDSTGISSAQFTSGNKNVIQLNFAECQHHCQRIVEVMIRVNETLPWSRIKSFVRPPDSFVFALNIPSGLYVMISTNETIISSGAIF